MDAGSDERRRFSGHLTLKAGHIAINPDGTVDCRIRNMSPEGACLEVASQAGIPDRFLLVVEEEDVQQPCHVVWRTATRMGVAFEVKTA